MLNITKCDIVEIITEGHRFLIHIFLVTLINNIFNDEQQLISSTLVKTLLATAIAVILYHLLIKRLLEPKLKLLKKICDDEK
uniref:Uncharacterized protein n=1 Tax=viral metagenome TaxID=1070528 RepID=A0A6C0EBN1_9ZZZZ